MLGGNQRREQRRMYGSEHGQPLRLGEQAAGPGHRLQRGTLIIGLAAVALPAADRQHELDARPVGHLRESYAVCPPARPPLRHHRDRSTRGTVGAEQTQLEPVGAAHRGAGSSVVDGFSAFTHSFPSGDFDPW